MPLSQFAVGLRNKILVGAGAVGLVVGGAGVSNLLPAFRVTNTSEVKTWECLLDGSCSASGDLLVGSGSKKVRVDSRGNVKAQGTMTGNKIYAGTLSGAGLTDCDAAPADKLLWDATTRRFSCGTDQNSGGTGNFGTGNTVTVGDSRYVKRQGDTMTGALNIRREATTTGSELAANGTFTGNANGWTLGAGWAYGSNRVAHTPGGTAALSQSLALARNASYRISFTLGGTVGDVTIDLAGEFNNYSAGAGAQSFDVELPLVPGAYALTFTPSSNTDATIDDVSVRQLLPARAALRFLKQTNAPGEIIDVTVQQDAYLQLSASGSDGGMSWGWKNESGQVLSGVYTYSYGTQVWRDGPDNGGLVAQLDLNDDGALLQTGNDGEVKRGIYMTQSGIYLRTNGVSKMVNLDPTKIASSDKTFTFQNASGTAALLDVSQIFKADQTLRTNLTVQGTMTGNHLYVGTFSGAGLTDCDTGATSKLLWDATTKRFSCGTDATGGGRITGTGAINQVAVFNNASGTNLSGATLFNWVHATKQLGLGTASPKAKLHVVGSGAFTGTLSGSAVNIQGGPSTISGSLSLGGLLRAKSGASLGPKSATLAAGDVLHLSGSVVIENAKAIQFKRTTGVKETTFQYNTDNGLYISNGAGSIYFRYGASLLYAGVMTSAGNWGFGHGLTGPGSANAVTVSGATLISRTGNAANVSADPRLTIEIIGTASGNVLHAQDALESSGALAVRGAARLQGALTLANPTVASGSPSALCLTATGAVVVNTGGSTCAVSSLRFKHDVVSLDEDALGLVMLMRPVSYKENGTDRPMVGLAAEELEKLDPRLTFSDTSGTRGVRYENLTAVLVKAVQQLSEKNDALERRVAELEGRVKKP